MPIEHAFVVGAELKYPPQAETSFEIEDSLEELATLAVTAGLEVEGGTYQRLENINPSTLIGSGKVDELVSYRDELGIDVFLFDDELSPRQQRELEKRLNVKIVDRTALILDIFARHARTREGQLQVELAQYEYRLPRLTRMWTHLARQAGGRAGGATGGVGLRGPGETQLEVDRREINHRIAHLRRELEKVRAHRARHRQQRQRSGISVVAIVGYTNAGKSTLLNQLAQADVLAADQLFATLDPTTRQVTLPSKNKVLFSDTVGFIQKLPTNLVAAFRATLEEIVEADLILHVVDITHPNAAEQAAVVNETLALLGAQDVPQLVALNKIDRLENPELATEALAQYPNSLAVSAKTGYGLEALLNRIEGVIQLGRRRMRLMIPYQRGDLVSLLYKHAIIERETHEPGGTRLEVHVPRHLIELVAAYQLEPVPEGGSTYA
ncbi:MAG TPA: GTPase HflX [Anaerolineae bacterium]|nr:GTPase HflX [Anaerolineae bacterium]HMR65902.1 GTPase HflX [Anaerolineae bacterium]